MTNEILREVINIIIFNNPSYRVLINAANDLFTCYNQLRFLAPETGRTEWKKPVELNKESAKTAIIIVEHREEYLSQAGVAE